jgi:dipeptidyl aminopeptidase/acylaminoacyl peptidase
MRTRWPLIVALALLVVAVAAPARAQEQANGVVLFDPSADEPPPPLLADDEVERIDRLQNEAVYTLAVSPVSPDDQYVMVSSGEQIGLLNIQDGSSVALDSAIFERFVPLPLLGLAPFSWLDTTTIGTLAIDLASRDPATALVRLAIDRETFDISADVISLPADTGVVSVAPDLERFLLVVLPPQPDEGGAGQGSRAVRVRVAPPAPSQARSSRPDVPPGVRRAVERALASPAMARLELMQDGAETGEVAVTPTTLDLVLFGGDQPGLRYVTTVPAASALIGQAWTRDSSRVAVSLYGVADFEGARETFDGALLSEEIYRDATGNMPPSINPLLQNNNTYAVDFASGATQVLRPDAGAAPPILAAHAWSTDNRTLLVQAWHPARLKGRSYPIYTPQFSERMSFRFYDTALNEVGRLESDLFSAPAFSSPIAQFVSPDELIFRAYKGTDRHPFYYNRVSGELRDIADRAGSYWNVFATNNSRQIVFTYTSFASPPDVYRVGWDGKALARLTWFNEELRVFAGLREDPVSFKLRNGQQRTGVLIQPADAPFPPRNSRIVVWQEGGPGPAMTNQWLANVENPYALLPGMGVPLLVTPVAGRAGYTAAAFNALADGANFGSVDVDEQAEIVNQMITRGWTSRGKVGITGCSYGGYFTLQSVVRHPDLYAAANPQCALVDVTTDWTRGFDALIPYLEGLPPYSVPDEYRRDSPLYNAGRIKAAVLTFHGTEDFLPVVQNENLHLQLFNRQVPSRMVKFLGEGHGLRDPASQLFAAQEQLSWFRAHLAE